MLTANIKSITVLLCVWHMRPRFPSECHLYFVNAGKWSNVERRNSGGEPTFSCTHICHSCVIKKRISENNDLSDATPKGPPSLGKCYTKEKKLPQTRTGIARRIRTSGDARSIDYDRHRDRRHCWRCVRCVPMGGFFCVWLHAKYQRPLDIRFQRENRKIINNKKKKNQRELKSTENMGKWQSANVCDVHFLAS